MPAIASPTVDAFFSAPVDAGKMGSTSVAQDSGTTESQFQNLMLGFLGQQAGDPKAETEGAGQQSIQTSTTQTDAPKVKDGKTLRSKGTTQDDLGVAAAASIIVPSTVQIIAQAVMPQDASSSETGSGTTDGNSKEVLQGISATKTTAPDMQGMMVSAATGQRNMRGMMVSAAQTGQSDMPSAGQAAASVQTGSDATTQTQTGDVQKPAEMPIAMSSDEKETAKTSDSVKVADIPMASTEAQNVQAVRSDQTQTAASQISKEGIKPDKQASMVAEPGPRVPQQDKVSAKDASRTEAAGLKSSLPESASGDASAAATNTTSQGSSDGNARQDTPSGDAKKQLKSAADPKVGSPDSTVPVITNYEAAQQSAVNNKSAALDDTEISVRSTKNDIESISGSKARSTGTDGISSDSQAVLAASHSKTQTDAASAASTSSVQTASTAAQTGQTMSTKMINQIVKAAKLQTFENGAGMSLRLDPPHLGSVQMNISTHNGTVTADLQTSTVTAKQMLESDLSALKKSLSDAGVNVDSISVSVGGNSTQSGGFHDQSAREYQENWRSSNSGFYQNSNSIDSASSVAAAARPAAGQLDFLA